MRDILLVGAGGFGREVAEAIRALNAVRPAWRLLGFLDDATAIQGTSVDGNPVVGRIEEVGRWPDAQVLVCTGHPGNYFSRKAIVDRLGLPRERYATVVHPAASIAATAEVGCGTAVLATTVVTARAIVGDHVAIMPAVVITHDDRVDSFATLGAGARLGGGVHICEGAYIGSGALVRENRTVGRWSLLGMGAAALVDIPEAEVWAGVPAARLRRVELAQAPGLTSPVRTA